MTVFDTPEAEALNRARMEHLESLGLDFKGKTVLEVGCGVGKLTPFFTSKPCFVHAIDARYENIAELIRRNPLESNRYARVVDVVSGDLPNADIVFCYGLLYHLTDPFRALQNMAATGADLLLLETIVCDYPLPVLLFDEEEAALANQSVVGFGTRPSVPLVTAFIKAAGWKEVYRPTALPDHPDFCWYSTNMMQWRQNGRNFRAVFIGSRNRLEADSANAPQSQIETEPEKSADTKEGD